MKAVKGFNFSLAAKEIVKQARADKTQPERAIVNIMIDICKLVESKKYMESENKRAEIDLLTFLGYGKSEIKKMLTSLKFQPAIEKGLFDDALRTYLSIKDAQNE